MAALHGLLGKRVAVVMQQDIFDAFSTGMGSTSIKMLMMMLRDRAMQLESATKATVAVW